MKSTGDLKTYIYYHCTKRKPNIVCKQERMTLKELENQIEETLERYTILPKFQEWALDILNKNNDKEIEDRTKIYETQQKSLLDTQKELDALTKMRYRELIDDETFIKERDDLKSKISKLQANLKDTENRADKWLELTEKTFNFALYARKGFLLGDLQQKKEIFTAIGQNFSVKDKKLHIISNEWFVPIEKAYPELKARFEALELDKTLDDTRRRVLYTNILLDWCGIQSQNGTGLF